MTTERDADDLTADTNGLESAPEAAESAQATEAAEPRRPTSIRRRPKPKPTEAEPVVG
jgi:hypothetical protein